MTGDDVAGSKGAGDKGAGDNDSGAKATEDGPVSSTVDFAATSPLLGFRELMRREPERFRSELEARLAEHAPHVRAELPRNLDATWRTFDALYRYLLGAIDATNGDRSKVDAILDWCREIGHDVAKYELSDRHFTDFGAQLDATFATLAGAAWNERLATVHRQFYEMIVEAVAAGQREAVDEAGPRGVRMGATVVEVQRPVRDLAVVRLLTDAPIDYHPGQYLSVLTPYAHAEWRYLSPSLPANPARQLEFHVRAVPGGAVSPGIVALASPGDRWVVASPVGEMEIHRNPAEPQDVLIIAGGTGIAPVRAMLFDLARFADNPRVHLFYGAKYPGELYDLGPLIELASHSPWLTVQPVAEERENPWWLDTSGAAPIPRTFHRFTYGRLDKVVTAYGGWGDRQILLSGPPAMLRATREALIAKGAPPENISHDPLPGS